MTTNISCRPDVINWRANVLLLADVHDSKGSRPTDPRPVSCLGVADGVVNLVKLRSTCNKSTEPTSNRFKGSRQLWLVPFSQTTLAIFLNKTGLIACWHKFQDDGCPLVFVLYHRTAFTGSKSCIRRDYSLRFRLNCTVLYCFFIYRVGQIKVNKYWLIFKILSLLHSAGNLQWIDHYRAHHTLMTSLAALPCEILMSENIACPICCGTAS